VKSEGAVIEENLQLSYLKNSKNKYTQNMTKKQLPEVHIFSDGGANPNPGPG